jgi:hypothetical protein
MTLFYYLPQIEREKRKAKTQKVQSETAAMVQETPEQRADRLAKELIEVKYYKQYHLVYLTSMNQFCYIYIYI